MRSKDTPNPGSKEAVAQGCKCPVLDNAHGKGFPYGEDGKPEFWITEGCPLHDVKGGRGRC